MKIDRIKGLVGPYRTGMSRPIGQQNGLPVSRGGAPVDAVNLSDKARWAVSVKARMDTVPEVRMDLVERLKAQVEAGTYNVDPKLVADKLLKAKVLD